MHLIWNRVLLVLAVLNVSLSSATLIKLLKRQVVQDEYDFIIVGGGTAGLALAARLTQDGTQSVLVLEAGQKPTDVLSYETPGADIFLQGTIIDWYFVTPPQTTTANRTLPYHRGRCLGGSSSINGLAYVRGSASIYDGWEALGNPGWSWNDVYPLFIKSTTFNPVNNNNESYSGFDPNAYSNGPLQVGYPGYVTPSTVAFVEACSAIDVPIVAELNNGSSIGVKVGTATIDGHFARSDSYDSYYYQARGRANLDVLTLAPVQRINFNQTTSALIATGVVFQDQPTGNLLNVTAKKEVILSAGTFQTPQLMMLSGIGPAKVLEQNGIALLLENENIGQNLQDNPLFAINARVEAAASTSEIANNYGILFNEENAWFDHRAGRLTTPTGVTNAYQELSIAELQQLGGTDLIAKGRTNQTHIEYTFTTIFYPGMPSPQYAPLINESYFSIAATLNAATSRGNISIQSNNPSDSPVINLNYLSTTFDQQTAIYAFKNLRTILADAAMQQYTIGPYNGEVSPGPSVQTDEDILAFIKNTTIPNWHACGTCAMLPQAQGGVVDSRLRVYGVKGLRVVDASIFPVIPDANIVAATYMVAEKAALLIAEDNGFVVN